MAEKNVGKDKIKKESVSDIYTIKLYFITNRENWENNREAIIEFVKVFKETNEKINFDSILAQKDLEEYFNYEEGWLDEQWQGVDYSFSTDHQKILKS